MASWSKASWKVDPEPLSVAAASLTVVVVDPPPVVVVVDDEARLAARPGNQPEGGHGGHRQPRWRGRPRWGDSCGMRVLQGHFTVPVRIADSDEP